MCSSRMFFRVRSAAGQSDWHECAGHAGLGQIGREQFIGRARPLKIVQGGCVSF